MPLKFQKVDKTGIEKCLEYYTKDYNLDRMNITIEKDKKNLIKNVHVEIIKQNKKEKFSMIDIREYLSPRFFLIEYLKKSYDKLEESIKQKKA